MRYLIYWQGQGRTPDHPRAEPDKVAADSVKIVDGMLAFYNDNRAGIGPPFAVLILHARDIERVELDQSSTP